MSKAREVRQLGSVRQSSSYSQFSSRPLKLDSKYEGISGSAMSVPVPKALPEASAELSKRSLCSPPTVTKKPAATSDQSTKVKKRLTQDINNENKKLKEALEREKELQQRIAMLVQLVDSLKSELKDKDNCIANLDGQLLTQEEEYKALFEKEQSSHEATKQNLEKVKAELEQNLQYVEELKRQHANQVKDMAAAVRKCEANIADLQASKEKEIALREEKLERLKKQMADALTGNSKERHLQLDELSKELGKVQEEAELLRIKLKSMQKTSKDGCTNCDSLSDKLRLLSSNVKQEEKKNNELKDKLTLLQKRLSENQSKTSLDSTKSKTTSKVTK